MEKVKLPREVAKALDEILRETEDKQYILWYAPQPKNFTDDSPWGILYQFVGNGRIFDLADALRYGYEPESEPITVTITTEQQENVRELYKEAIQHKENAFLMDHTRMEEYWRGKLQGIRDTLDELKINVNGVNA